MSNEFQKAQILSCYGVDINDLEKGHKYLRKEADGKGGWNYIYKEKENHIEKVKKYAERIIDKLDTLKRLSPTEEQGRLLSGRRNVEATILIGTDERASDVSKTPEERKERQEELLEKWAKESGCWIETLPEINPKYFVDRGAEAKVYKYGNNNVLKVNNLSQHEEPIEFLDRLAIHNALFPETKYTLLGFNRTDGEFSAIVKQPFIYIGSGNKNTFKNKMLVQADMESRGFEYQGGNMYLNNDYLVEDLHSGNALVDKNGEIFYIDPIVRLNVSGEGYDGKRKFGQIKI